MFEGDSGREINYDFRDVSALEKFSFGKTIYPDCVHARAYLTTNSLNLI